LVARARRLRGDARGGKGRGGIRPALIGDKAARAASGLVCSMVEGRMDLIRKDLAALGVQPNLLDYEAERAGFSWEAERAALDGLPGGRGLNIAHEAVDRHAAGPRAGKPALRWLGRKD